MMHIMQLQVWNIVCQVMKSTLQEFHTKIVIRHVYSMPTININVQSITEKYNFRK